MENIKQSVGRKRLPVEAKKVVIAARLLPADAEKFKRIGGVKWLSAQIKKAKLPRTTGDSNES